MKYIIEDFYGQAHYNLDEIQMKIMLGEYIITQTAKINASKYFNLSREQLIEQILKLTKNNIYKTMKSKAFINLWQDVYHLNIDGKIAYIKLQINYDKSIVIQFKEK